MHWRALVVAVVLLAVILPAQAAAAPRCSRRGGDTIYRDHTLRVLQRIKQSKSDPDANTVRIFFCKPSSRATPKRLETFHNNLDGSLAVLDVSRAGNHVALSLDEETGTNSATDLFVYNLSKRKRTFSYSNESPYTYVATHGGAVAILAAGTLTGYDGSGKHALATGASALAGTGNTIYWSEAGMPKSGTLSGEATDPS